jgi:hypothetical protein
MESVTFSLIYSLHSPVHYFSRLSRIKDRELVKRPRKRNWFTCPPFIPLRARILSSFATFASFSPLISGYKRLQRSPEIKDIREKHTLIPSVPLLSFT